MQAGDLVGIWQWNKDEQEVALLVKILKTCENTDGTLRQKWLLIDSNGMRVEVWEEHIYEMGKAEVQQPPPFDDIVIPSVRRVFPSMIANEIVSVQPMSLPTGLLFYLDYYHGTEDEQDEPAEGIMEEE